MKYKIKWESNSKVKKNSKIKSADIVKSLAEALKEKNVASVRLHDMRKTYPSASIYFNGVNSTHTNENKAKTLYPRLIVHVDTNPKSLTVEFSSDVKNPLEIMKVVNEVVSIIQCQKEKDKRHTLSPLAQG